MSLLKMAEVTNAFPECETNTVNVKESVSFNDLSNFVVKRVLSENSQRKTIIAEGSFIDKEGIAILFLEKTPINAEALHSLCSKHSALTGLTTNDIYGCYTCNPEKKFGAIKTTIIYPATEKHVKKYESQPFHIIEESPELYNTITLPYLTSEAFNLQWVYNILNHEAEQESIVFEDTDSTIGFILIPDLKWDQKQTENLYLLAIINKRDIKSLRDLTAEHLPLLKNIKEKGTKVIQEKYGLDKSRLRIYIHYQPSYYHLHIHFTYLQFEAPGIHTEKSHMLTTVIDNIEMVPHYYQRATLPFTIKQTDNLFLRYKEIGLVKEVPPKEPLPPTPQVEKAAGGDTAE